MSYIKSPDAFDASGRLGGRRSTEGGAALDEPNLLELWHERNRLIGLLRAIDEQAQQDLHAVLSRSWDQLDQRIVTTASRSVDDLRGKLAFMRWWLREPDDSQQYQLMLSIVDDVERMILPGLDPDEDPPHEA
ncbi:hypothetical protein [Geminicoccus flavidas]|uniref:hypothetical protein n=1 Tax=Geminicoccus flavidas TaxID=2506407 RepID=UPI00135680C5|nr:hypothetical protein [Geminicoccus flavidas]